MHVCLRMNATEVRVVYPEIPSTLTGLTGVGLDEAETRGGSWRPLGEVASVFSKSMYWGQPQISDKSACQHYVVTFR